MTLGPGRRGTLDPNPGILCLLQVPLPPLDESCDHRDCLYSASLQLPPVLVTAHCPMSSADFWWAFRLGGGDEFPRGSHTVPSPYAVSPLALGADQTQSGEVVDAFREWLGLTDGPRHFHLPPVPAHGSS